MMDGIWLTATLVFVAASFATLSLAAFSEFLGDWHRKRKVAKRLKPVLSGRVKRLGGGDGSELLRSEEGSGGLFGGMSRLSIFIEQGRVDWTPRTFLILTLGLGLGFGATALALSANLILAGMAATGGAAIPYFYTAAQRRRRFRLFEEQFPESIDLLTRAIRAGHPLTSGMQMVAEEGPEEVALEFRRTVEENRFGLPFEEALLGFVDRTNLVDVRIFAIAVLVQREVGGNLAEILANLAHTIRRRFHLRRQLKVYTAQGRMTGYALGALPIVVGFILFLLEPEYVTLLFSNLFGRFMVGTAVVLQLTGVLWIRRVIDIDY
jgi:tight adherence protein B